MKSVSLDDCWHVELTLLLVSLGDFICMCVCVYLGEHNTTVHVVVMCVCLTIHNLVLFLLLFVFFLI